MKNIYLIVGPSGSGKTTIANHLEKYYGLRQVQSYTTRPPRYDGETGHIFVSDEEFDALGEMCAYTEYNGHRYGVTPEIIETHDIYVIDPYGVDYMKKHYHGSKGVKTIRLKVPCDILADRMRARGDSEENIKKRLEVDSESFSENYAAGTYDLVITNYNLGDTISDICDFLWEQED